MAMNEDVLMANTIAAHNSLKLFPCTSITGTIIEDDILRQQIFLLVFTVENYLSKSQHIHYITLQVKQNNEAVNEDTVDGD